jgi:hypothetical protein
VLQWRTRRKCCTETRTRKSAIFLPSNVAILSHRKIDLAFENIFNIIFYAIVITIIISRLGFDPLALFLSISGVVLGFAFMISSASSKYFEVNDRNVVLVCLAIGCLSSNHLFSRDFYSSSSDVHIKLAMAFTSAMLKATQTFMGRHGGRFAMSISLRRL